MGHFRGASPNVADTALHRDHDGSSLSPDPVEPVVECFLLR